LLVRAGFAVLLPERRGWGESEGPKFDEEVTPGPFQETRLLARIKAESDDVLAAIAYAKTLPFVNGKRIALVGYSLGGMATVFAAGRTAAIAAVVDQAGGSVSWQNSAAVRKALPEAAAKIQSPILCMVAENDATTAAVEAVCDAARAAGTLAELKVYPPYTPHGSSAGNDGPVPPGHFLFQDNGLQIWGDDLIAFLGKHLVQPSAP
jgi:dienelactone hydrolase